MANHPHSLRGSMAALTPVPVEMHQHHIILEIIELNTQTGSLVLRVMEWSVRVLYMYRETSPFDELVQRGINRGM